MSGRMSRNKGARGERSLALHLNLIGYDARRVIRTRAVGGYENDVVPDVIATKDGVEYSFESKYRKNSFKTVYKIYEKFRTGNVYRFAMSPQGPHIAIGTDFEEVRRGHDTHFAEITGTLQEFMTHQKIMNMHKWLKGAQYLAIKDNCKKPLFIRFWI